MVVLHRQSVGTYQAVHQQVDGQLVSVMVDKDTHWLRVVAVHAVDEREDTNTLAFAEGDK